MEDSSFLIKCVASCRMNIQCRLTSVNIIIESAENIQALLCFKSSLQSASNIIQ